VEEDGQLVEDFPLELESGLEIKAGYVLSKFVGEKLMDEARRRGIPVTVIRYAAIVGNSVTGAMPNGYNHAWSIMLACIRVKKFPHLDNNGVPFMAVDTAARVSANIFLNDKSEDGIYNLHCGSSTSEEDVLEAFRKFGVEGSFVPYAEWRNTVFEEMDKNSLGPVAELYANDEAENPVYLTYHPLGQKMDNLNMNEASEKVKRNCQNSWEVLNPKDLLEKHLKFHFDNLTKNP